MEYPCIRLGDTSLLFFMDNVITGLPEIYKGHVMPHLGLVERAWCRLLCRAHLSVDPAFRPPRWLGLLSKNTPRERLPWGHDIFVRELEWLGWPELDSPTQLGYISIDVAGGLVDESVMVFRVEWKYSHSRRFLEFSYSFTVDSKRAYEWHASIIPLGSVSRIIWPVPNIKHELQRFLCMMYNGRASAGLLLESIYLLSKDEGFNVPS